MHQTRRRRLIPLAPLLLAAACGRGGASPTESGTQSPTTVGSVSVSPGTITLQLARTASLTAEVRDPAGRVLSGARVTWQSSAPAVATVDDAGVVTAVAVGTATISATSGGRTGSATLTVDARYDLDALGPPMFIAAHYIDPATIARISRFRSSVGHDYADDAERCRSMKHYFVPRASEDWSAVAIHAPVEGTITRIAPETTAGDQIQIVPRALPAATVIIFHVVRAPGLAVGSQVSAGTRLGTHVGAQTFSDIAIRLETPRGARLISYFEALPDPLFEPYRTRGVATRQALVISRAERDANPLQCAGEQFQSPGALESWVTVQP